MGTRSENSMWHRLFQLSADSGQSLQSQLRESLVKAILDGHIQADVPLPSSRELARQLGVARNTVVLAYQHLIDERYLLASERRGYFVNPAILEGRVAANRGPTDVSRGSQIDWQNRLTHDLSQQENIQRPIDWQRYEYPFIYGQVDPSLFPVNDWRESCRLSLRVGAIHEWTTDRVDHDDPLLVEQILTRVLPRRGVWASADEILITSGAQNALYLVAQLLLDKTRTVGLEDPCYVDARNIFSLFTDQQVLFPVGEQGVMVDDRAQHCELLYVTPSHQCPTTTTLPLENRVALLKRAAKQDFLILEDDYESELSFAGQPTPALKSLDQNGRVIYVGSLSKTLAPGLRVGFMVAPAEVIRQARALRRLMYRHPPTNNQRTVGHFLALGHHDSVMLRISETFRARWIAMDRALSQHLNLTSTAPVFGGSSFWVALPEHVSARELEALAAEQGIIINAGDNYFATGSAGSVSNNETGPQENANPERRPEHFFRLGFSSIEEKKIEPGIQKLAAIVKHLAS